MVVRYDILIGAALKQVVSTIDRCSTQSVTLNVKSVTLKVKYRKLTGPRPLKFTHLKQKRKLKVTFSPNLAKKLKFIVLLIQSFISVISSKS